MNKAQGRSLKFMSSTSRTFQDGNKLLDHVTCRIGSPCSIRPLAIPHTYTQTREPNWDYIQASVHVRSSHADFYLHRK
jgi:hypothetical protein